MTTDVKGNETLTSISASDETELRKITIRFMQQHDNYTHAIFEKYRKAYTLKVIMLMLAVGFAWYIAFSNYFSVGQLIGAEVILGIAGFIYVFAKSNSILIRNKSYLNYLENNGVNLPTGVKEKLNNLED